MIAKSKSVIVNNMQNDGTYKHKIATIVWLFHSINLLKYRNGHITE